MALRFWPFSSGNGGSSTTQTQTLESDFIVPNSNVVVMDCGSSECRAGFAGENHQRISIPTVVGRPKTTAAVGFRPTEMTYVGIEAQQMRAVVNLKTPIERGIITNWDDMEIIFEYIINGRLHVDPSLFSILLTDTVNNPNYNREKLAELMMEKFQFKAFTLVPAAPLALYTYGFVTGVVLDSGEGQTHIVPVYEGLSMSHSAHYIPLGGLDINTLLGNIIARSGKAPHYFQTTRELRFLRDIKENLCYVAYDYNEELYNPRLRPKPYQLPDGNWIQLDNELFGCTEALFDPMMLDVETGGIHENIYRAIHLADSSIQDLLYSHIVLSGGNTLFPGFQQRLAKEMRSIAEADTTISIHGKSDRQNAVFFGASLLGSLTKFNDMVITYEEYFETGPSIVKRKCF